MNGNFFKKKSVRVLLIFMCLTMIFSLMPIGSVMAEEKSVTEADESLENVTTNEEGVISEKSLTNELTDNNLVEEVDLDENNQLTTEGESKFFISNAPDSSSSLFDKLKAQVTSANDGDVISLEDGVYKFTETLNIENKKLTFKGSEGVKFVRENGFSGTMVSIAETGGLTLDGAITFDGEKKPIRLSHKTGSFVYTKGSLVINGSKFINDYDDKNNMIIAPIFAQGKTAKVEFNSGEVSGTNYESDNGGNNWYSAGGFFLNDGANMIMNGGKISNNLVSWFPYSTWADGKWTNSSSAGAIMVNDGSNLIINDGEISNNLSYAGGILLGTYDIYAIDRNQPDGQLLKDLPISTFTINGGRIAQNVGCYSAGGIFIYGNGKMDLNGGDIINNRGYAGGGILALDNYVDGGVGTPQTRAKAPFETWSKKYPAALTMNGGNVSNNYAYTCGGGINVASDNVKLLGGTISNNTSQDQGGGVYVTATPYRLRVENAYISENSANRFFPTVLTYYDNITYRLTPKSGGGVWLCPTGEAEFYAENGVVITDNNAGNAGDDFHNEDKALNHVSTTLPNRTNGGVAIKYYEDFAGNRYSPESKEITSIKNSKEHLSLKTVISKAGLDYGKSLSRLYITGNKSSKGGGIGSNGTVIFGKNQTISLDIVKTFSKGSKVKPIEVEVYVEIPNGPSYVLEKVNLNKENGYEVTLRDLPATIGGHKFEDVVKVKELNAEEYQLIEAKSAKEVDSKVLSFDIRRPEFSVYGGNIHADYDEASEIIIKLEGDALASPKLEKMAKTDDFEWKGTVSFEDIMLDSDNIKVEYYMDKSGKPFETNLKEYTLKLDKVNDGYILKIPALKRADGYTGDEQVLQLKNKKVADNKEYKVIFNLENNEKTSVKVTKEWSGIKADKTSNKIVEVELLKGDIVIDTAKLNANNSWAHTFENLDPIDSDTGKTIEYRVREKGSKDGQITLDGDTFKITIEKIKDGEFKITNKLIPPMTPLTPPNTDLKVTKEWKNIPKGKPLPVFVEVELLANGEVVDSVKLNKENNWSHSFKELPLLEDITAKDTIKYSVREKGVLDGTLKLNNDQYEVSVIAVNNGEYKIINKFVPPTPPPSNPPTGDRSSIMIYLILLAGTTYLLKLLKSVN